LESGLLESEFRVIGVRLIGVRVQGYWSQAYWSQSSVVNPEPFELKLALTTEQREPAVHNEDSGSGVKWIRGIRTHLKKGSLRSRTFPDLKPDWSTVAVMMMS